MSVRKSQLYPLVQVFSQNAVDQPRLISAVSLGKLYALVNCSIFRNRIHISQLIYAHPQDGQFVASQTLDTVFDEKIDIIVQGKLVFQNSVNQLTNEAR